MATMEQVSSVDLHYLIKELDFLKDQRVDNFYYSDEIYYICIYVKRIGNIYLTIKPDSFLYHTNKKDFTSEPNHFVNYLRKYLKNSFIEEIKKINRERIIKITLSKKALIKGEEKIIKYYLIVELFKPGNIVLVDSEDKILNTSKQKTFRDRVVRTKQKYEFPPKKETNFSKESLNKLDEKDQELSIVRYIAREFSLGGKYSEEVLERSKIDKNKQLKDISKKEIQKIEEEVVNIFNMKIEPYSIIKDDIITKFIPFKFVTITEDLQKEESFNIVLQKYFFQFKNKKDIRAEELKKQIKKLENRVNILKKQENAIIKESEDFNETGNKIYENYEVIENIIKLGKELENNPEKETPEEYSKYIKKIDKKEKSIELNGK